MSKTIGLLQKMIRYFLREYELLRNDDIDLQIAIIKHKHAYWVRTEKDGTQWVAVPGLRRYTQDNVKRIRAKVQNEEWLYLPTDPEVRKARKIGELEWQKWLFESKPPIRHWNDTDKD